MKKVLLIGGAILLALTLLIPVGVGIVEVIQEDTRSSDVAIEKPKASPESWVHREVQRTEELRRKVAAGEISQAAVEEGRIGEDGLELPRPVPQDVIDENEATEGGDPEQLRWTTSWPQKN